MSYVTVIRQKTGFVLFFKITMIYCVLYTVCHMLYIIYVLLYNTPKQHGGILLFLFRFFCCDIFASLTNTAVSLPKDV